MADSGTQRQSTYYDRLGVKPTASAQQIRRAYRDLSKLYHPDTTELSPEVATPKFQQLNEAYATLSNPERRLTYDRQLGYSRISVIQPPTYLNQSVRTPQRTYSSNAYLDPSDRPLSAGEMFALFILGITFVACLALVITIGVTQGEIVLQPETAPGLTTGQQAQEQQPLPPTSPEPMPAAEAGPAVAPDHQSQPAPEGPVLPQLRISPPISKELKTISSPAVARPSWTLTLPVPPPLSRCCLNWPMAPWPLGVKRYS